MRNYACSKLINIKDNEQVYVDSIEELKWLYVNTYSRWLQHMNQEAKVRFNEGRKYVQVNTTLNSRNEGRLYLAGRDPKKHIVDCSDLMHEDITVNFDAQKALQISNCGYSCAKELREILDTIKHTAHKGLTSVSVGKKLKSGTKEELTSKGFDIKENWSLWIISSKINKTTISWKQ